MRSFLIVSALLGWGATCNAQPVAKQKIYFGRLGQPDISLCISDGDGRHEHLLVPHRELEYSPSFSHDGRWIVFTRESDGLADIYRVHPDGSELQQLTNDPAFDDQGVLSPDGKTLAFVSSRGSGRANIWTLNLATKNYTDLTHDLSGNFRPSWSPDGKWIAFSSDREPSSKSSQAGSSNFRRSAFM